MFPEQSDWPGGVLEGMRVGGTGLGVFVGCAVFVGGTEVAVGGIAVAVGGKGLGVLVGGKDVLVGWLVAVALTCVGVESLARVTGGVALAAFTSPEVVPGVKAAPVVAS